jgi:glutathione S-transferase
MERILYHLPLSAPSRKVRLALAEKGLIFSLEIERVWERRMEFLSLNPAGDVPVLVEPQGAILVDGQVICEYLEESYAASDLLGPTPIQRAETRRLTSWFDLKFSEEVTDNLVGEKYSKRLFGLGDPHAPAIRAGLANIHYHLEYIEYLSEQRRWLAGDDFSLADIAAAAQLSVVDFIGDVPWDKHPQAKDWYARVKSRPSFRPLLADQVMGIQPALHYANLDF